MNHTISSVIEWQRKPCDDYDRDIGIRFRRGNLKEGDIYKIEKYKGEGLQSILLLPNSVIMFGFSWFRYIPTGSYDNPLTSSAYSSATTKSQEAMDEMSIILVNSVISALRDPSKYTQGQLMNYIARGDVKHRTPNVHNILNVQRSLGNRTDNSGSVNQSFVNEQMSMLQTSFNDSRNIQGRDYDESMNILDSPDQKNNIISPLHDYTRMNAVTPLKRQMYFRQNDHDGSGVIFDDFNYKEVTKPWYEVERNEAPTGVPKDLMDFIVNSKWDAMDVQLKGKEEEFNLAIKAIFVAMRTPVSPPYDFKDENESTYDVGLKTLEKIKRVYNQDENLEDKENRVKSNQYLWILGSILKSCGNANINRLAKANKVALTTNTKFPPHLPETCPQIVEIWGENVPISRMQTLSLSFYHTLEKFGKNSNQIFLKAINILKATYPHTILN
ncbi:hypothetical protein K502DRAFT_331169 [Neoconidiobolus thromboides FSU 785]|nr:hypothetical protein K502DRAFT_331169 [Neoconidiobolus thromboides FSU 785]